MVIGAGGGVLIGAGEAQLRGVDLMLGEGPVQAWDLAAVGVLDLEGLQAVEDLDRGDHARAAPVFTLHLKRRAGEGLALADVGFAVAVDHHVLELAGQVHRKGFLET
ncbi:hypothetical protein D3C80_1506690 [compost metagenome]